MLLKRILMKDSAAKTPLWVALGIHIFLIIGVIFSFFPIFYLVTTAFKTNAEAISIPPTWVPSKFTLDGFTDLFTQIPIFIMLYNSVFTTILVIFGQVFFSALAGFSLAKIDFPCRKIILAICLAILMIPSQIYYIPQYLLLQKIGLTNTLLGIALPGMVSAFGTFLFRQAFLVLPNSLYEAALLDGCNPFRIFWSVMFPLVKPTCVAFGILAALYNWNALLWPLIVNTSQSKYTLSVGIATLLGTNTNISYPTLMASALIALVPMITLFLIFGKHILENNSYLGDK